jgi:hypothetical protein
MQDVIRARVRNGLAFKSGTCRDYCHSRWADRIASIGMKAGREPGVETICTRMMRQRGHAVRHRERTAPGPWQ